MARKPKPDAPCLDDPRWLPLVEEVHERLSRRTGRGYLAARDLTAVLASKRMRCMRRDLVSDHRELVPAAFWTDHELYEDSPLWVVGPRNRPRDVPVTPLTNWVFYVWRPDVAKVWPALLSADDDAVTASMTERRKPADDAEPPTDERRKPGRKPTENWPLHVAGELHRIVVIEGKTPPRASYFAEFCDEKLGYMPDISAVQKLIKALLG